MITLWTICIIYIKIITKNDPSHKICSSTIFPLFLWYVVKMAISWVSRHVILLESLAKSTNIVDFFCGLGHFFHDSLYIRKVLFHASCIGLIFLSWGKQCIIFQVVNAKFLVVKYVCFSLMAKKSLPPHHLLVNI